MLPLLYPGESLASFLGRPGLYRRLRFRVRQVLWTWQGNHEEAEWHLLDHLVDPNRAAVDVGANYGGYAGRLARLATRVYCFEPFPETAERLALRMPPSAVVRRAAVSDHAGTAELLVPSKASGEPAVANATLEAANPVTARDDLRAVTCELVTLDEVVPEPVGFIKIDVEGHELAVLRGAAGILERDRPALLVESAPILNPEAPEHVFRFLGERGYEGLFLLRQRLHSIHAFDKARHQRQDATGRPMDPYAYNFIFLPGG
ncbi:FkbM family methyltransferase [Elioraea sp.]|uniref:FkbM family methyltransferase n=1 Tax=Elioraea sp. TaxID=2185103 RepID=UPI003F6E7814